MRAFVAVIPPAAVLAELVAAVAPLRAGHSGLRWTPSGQWHLTLTFLGEIDEGVLPDLAERLARAARRNPPMDLALGGAGRFGDRVLWTRVLAAHPAEPDRLPSGSRRQQGRGAVDDLRALAASVGAAARRCRIVVDDRPYRPHLTLARGCPGSDLRPLVDALRGFVGMPWTADDLHLVRSRLGAGPGGTAVHEVIATWPLGRPSTNA
jgi:2'-5' RNA ligase